MKYLKFLLIALVAISFTANAQIKTIDVRSTQGPLMQYGHEALLTTAADVATALDSIVVGANEVGVITVTLVGYNGDSPAGITGVKSVRYKKVAGTLTLGTIIDVNATVVDTALSGATWTLAVSGTNIVVRVTGITGLASGIKWKCRTEFVTRS